MTLEELYNILLSDNPGNSIRNNEEEIFRLIPELKTCKGFNQNNEWHIYDVYEHILHVVDEVSPNITMRLAALFHDIGKPLSYTEDENKVGHFFGHWDESIKIFNAFADKHTIDKDIRERINDLIYYHDTNISKMNDERLSELKERLGTKGIIELFELKRADLLAQNEKYHYILEEKKKQKELILNKGGNTHE